MTTLRICLQLVVVALALAASRVAADDGGGYEIQRGDVLRLSVAGVSDLGGDLAVEVDGFVSVPLIGRVAAVDRDLADVEAEIRVGLSTARYSLADPSGESGAIQINPRSVTVSMARYRPIFVDGDVRDPGAFEFAPGLTARRAIALAGGYGLAALRVADPTLDILELEAKLRELAINEAAESARLERLRIELEALDRDDDAKLDADAPAAGVLASTDLEGLPEVERHRLKATLDAESNRSIRLAALLAYRRGQITALREQYESEGAVVSADVKDFERLSAARDTGAVTLRRLADVRRNMLYSTTRQMQAGAELARAELATTELEFEDARVRIERRDAIFEEIGEVSVLLSARRSAMMAARRQIAYLRRAVDGPELGARAELTVIGSPGDIRRLPLEADAELRPGDLVVVRIEPRADPSAETRLP